MKNKNTRKLRVKLGGHPLEKVRVTYVHCKKSTPCKIFRVGLKFLK